MSPTTRRLGRRTPLTLLPLMLAGLLLMLVPSTASAWSYGVNEVQSATADSHAETGMGPGWVMLTYKANGPMVGYLFGPDFVYGDGTVKPGPDHMDIRDTGDGSAGNADIDPLAVGVRRRPLRRLRLRLRHVQVRLRPHRLHVEQLRRRPERRRIQPRRRQLPTSCAGGTPSPSSARTAPPTTCAARGACGAPTRAAA